MANKKVFTNLSFEGNSELINPRLNPGSTPASKGPGQAYFDTGGGGTLNLQFAAAGAANNGDWRAVLTSGVNFSTSGVYQSTLVASGGSAPPFVVASDDLVENLNADKLDGYHISTTAVASKIPIYATGGALLVGDPTLPSHAAPRKYVDNAVQGLDHKDSVRVATTANIDVTGGANDISAADVLDGVTLVAGDRVLVKNQNTASENGIYLAPGSGVAAPRAGDDGYGANIGGNTSSWTLGPTNVVLSGEVVTFTEAGGTAGKLTKSDVFEATSDLHYITFTIGTASANIWIGRSAISGVPYTSTNGYVTYATGPHTVALPVRSARTDIGINFHPSAGSSASTITDIQIRRADLQDGAFVFVEEGTTQANSSFVLQGDGATWTQFSGAGQLDVTSNDATAAPLTKAGDTIDFAYNTDRFALNSNALDVKDDGIDTDQLANDAVDADKLDDSATFIMAGLGIGSDSIPFGKLEVAQATAFTPVYNASVDNIVLTRDATTGSGNYGGSIGFSPIDSPNERMAVIAGIQTAGDTNQMGLAFFTHPSSTGGHDIVEALRRRNLTQRNPAR